MDQNAVNSRIAASIARRAGASSSEQFPVTIEQGSEPIRNRVGAGQIDATVKCSDWKEPERETGYKPADEMNVDPVEPDVADQIVLGNVTIQPNPIAGTWEGRFTRDGDSRYEVLVDGRRVTGDAALSAVYSALRAKKGK
jgi:hypothetical protein